jgi:anaerobic ribonucleoside-triphosphate reductase
MDIQTRLEDFGASGPGTIGYRCRYCGRVFTTEKGLNSHISRRHFNKDVPSDETLFTYERVEIEEGPGKRAVLKIYMDKAMLRDLMHRAAEFGYPFDVFIFKLLNIALAPTADEMEKIIAMLAKETGQDIFSPITHILYKGGTGQPVKLPKGPPAEVGPYIS